MFPISKSRLNRITLESKQLKNKAEEEEIKAKYYKDKVGITYKNTNTFFYCVLFPKKTGL